MTAQDQPENRYRCEARVPGKKSHEFPTVDHETARAVCDANGWELIRVYQPGGDSDRPKDAPVKGNRGLTPKQIQSLITEANATWRHLSKMGIVTDTFDDWRHKEVWKTVRREGLTKCQHGHYAPLWKHFRQLRGAPVNETTAAKPRRWSGEGGDTPERRNQVLALIAQELGAHARRVDKPQGPVEICWANHAIAKGGKIGEDYVLAIARRKNPATTLHDIGSLILLTASRIEHVLFSVRNAIAGREGRGDSENRHKKQKGL
jgi:hypothetical protein